LAVTINSRPAAFRTISEAADWVTEQFISQLREARAEHNVVAAKMKAECNAEIAEFRRELLAHHDAIVAEIKVVLEKSGYVAKTIGRGPRGAKQSNASGA
jgi:hypothetical protein